MWFSKDKIKHKEQKRHKNGGAVSVFLVIVLVPCLIINSLCIDLSRIILSRATAESAADLALNSLLTYYDFDLQDWYGMAASCQNIDEFYSGTAEYFLQTLQSTDMTDEQISTVYENFVHTFVDSEGVQDLLQISSTTDTGNMISAIPDANLTNPAIIRDQIVDFMKYRAPIEIASGVLSTLLSDNGDGLSLSENASEFVQQSENAKEAECKKEYYEREGEFSIDAYKAYKELQKYVNMGMTNGKLKGYLEDAASAKDLYEEIHEIMVKQLFNTSYLSEFTRLTSSTVGAETHSKIYDDISTKLEEIDGQDVYYTSCQRMQDAIDGLRYNIDNFNEKKSELESILNIVMNMDIGSGPSQISEIQWWVRADKLLESSEYNNFKDAAKDLVSQYNKVMALKDCVEDGGYEDEEITVDNNWIDANINNAEEIIDTYLKYNPDESSIYLRFVNKLEGVSSSHINDIDYSKVILASTGKGIDASLSEQASKIETDIEKLDEVIKQLGIIIDGGENSPKGLNAVAGEADEVGRAYDKWENEARTDYINAELQGSMKEEDRQILDEKERIDGEKIRTLVQRLENVKSQLEAVKAAINSLKYGNKTTDKISSYSVFKSAANSKVSASGIEACTTNEELDTYAANTFNQLISSGSLTLENENNSDYNPDLDVDSPEGYTYLKDLYKNVGDDSKLSEQESEQESAKDKTEEAGKAKDTDRYKGGGGDISRDFSPEGNAVGVSSLINGITNLFSDLTKGNFSSLGDNMRDSIYTTTYVMTMFSYATYDNQGKYNLLKKADASKIKELNTNNYNESGYYPSVTGAAGTRNSWLSTSLYDSYNKSLTNKMINVGNNYAFGAEAEYILFGENTSVENVKKMYTKIYEIRYALNLISGFQNFYSISQNNITAKAIRIVAAAVARISCGIIPDPVTKVILIALLTALETARDLDRLEAGFPVELYKSDDKMWWYAMESDSMETVGAFLNNLTGTKTNQDQGIFYKDYVTIFLLIGFSANDATSQAMYQRLAEVIQANMRKLTEKSDYSLKKSILYVKLSADIQVSPMMLSLPLFYSEENVLLQNSDWRTYDVEVIRGFN